MSKNTYIAVFPRPCRKWTEPQPACCILASAVWCERTGWRPRICAFGRAILPFLARRLSSSCWRQLPLQLGLLRAPRKNLISRQFRPWSSLAKDRPRRFPRQKSWFQEVCRLRADPGAFRPLCWPGEVEEAGVIFSDLAHLWHDFKRNNTSLRCFVRLIHPCDGEFWRKITLLYFEYPPFFPP